MICNKCGEQIPDGTTVCPKCGTGLAEDNAGAARNNTQTAVASILKKICPSEMSSVLAFTIAVAMLLSMLIMPVFSVQCFEEGGSVDDHFCVSFLKHLTVDYDSQPEEERNQIWTIGIASDIAFVLIVSSLVLFLALWCLQKFEKCITVAAINLGIFGCYTVLSGSACMAKYNYAGIYGSTVCFLFLHIGGIFCIVCLVGLLLLAIKRKKESLAANK